MGSKNLIKFPYNNIYHFQTLQYNKIINEVAKKHQIQTIDLYNPTNLKSEEDEKNFYSIDKFHPSEQGYLFWSQIINGNLNL